MNDPAKGRWLLLGVLRGIGVAIVLLGLMVTEGRFGLPYWVGVVMLAIGFAAAFVAPRVLSRRWRSPRP
ncbi:hypothetical protein PK98_00655 [Croceibacterium mercuriale]|uniref:Uncharacterized protein n=1 Tax=Croceibacterium mercuriale TaxID=1572751 RepID=A0A0B2BUP5_9SPHN|nr:hypothetical protein [Croceibacterium mercuriale]KHL25293.1 hypothetical protein PK98_00655 [Croceibacterium mercuriale]